MFEEGEANAATPQATTAPQQPAPAAAPAQPATATQQPAAQPAAPAQPANTTAGQPQAQAQPATQNQAQTAQPQQPQANPQQDKIRQEVDKFIEEFNKHLQEKNFFWALTFNLPQELEKAVPEFTQQNPEAKAGIDAWNAFKEQPSEQSFQAFITAVNTFAQGPQQQPAAEQQAVQTNAQQESISRNFGERLHEKFVAAQRADFIHNMVVEDRDKWPVY